MAYDFNKLQNLTDKIKAELQEVIDKYEPELLKLVQEEMNPKHYICSGMGTTFLSKLNGDDSYIEEEDSTFMHILKNVEWGNELDVNLSLPYQFSKKFVLRSNIQKRIQDLVEEFRKIHGRDKRPNLTHDLHLQYLQTGRFTNPLTNKFES